MKTLLYQPVSKAFISLVVTIVLMFSTISLSFSQSCPAGCCCGGCSTCNFVASDQVIYQTNCGPYTFNINCSGYGLSGVQWIVQETQYASIDSQDNNHITIRPTNAGYGKDIHVCVKPANAPNAVPCCKVIRFCPSIEISPDYYAKLETSSGQVAALFGSTCAASGWQSLTFSRYDNGGYLEDTQTNTTGRYKFYFNSTGSDSQYYNLKVTGVGVAGCPNAASECIRVHYIPYPNDGAKYYVSEDGPGTCGPNGGRVASKDEGIEVLTVYPNPVNTGTILFKSLKTMISITIVDVSGRTFNKIQANSVQAEVNCSKLSAGTYVANIITEDGQYAKKFIIQK